MSAFFKPIVPLPAELKPAPGPTGREVLAGFDAQGCPHYIDLTTASRRAARRALYGLWRAIEAEGGVALRTPKLVALVGGAR